MAITLGAAAKVGIGVGAGGIGVTGLYFGGDYLNNMTSIYDNALIYFLESDDEHDIVFDVKKDGNADLTSTDVVLSGTNSTVTVSAKVQIKNSSPSAFKKGNNNASTTDKGFNEIQELNSKKDGTGECEFKFTKESGANNSNIDTKYKNRIFESTNAGLFGILKQDINSYPEESKPLKKLNLKKIKIDFIRQCSYARTVSKNKELNGKTTLGTDDLKAKVELEFKDEGSNLAPKDMDTFNYGFNSRYENTTSTGN